MATSLDGTQWTIIYSQCLEGFVNDPPSDSDIPNFQTLSPALINAFHVTNTAILVLDGYMVALIKDNDCFAMFDSHARTAEGMPTAEGVATICSFATLAAF